MKNIASLYVLLLLIYGCTPPQTVPNDSSSKMPPSIPTGLRVNNTSISSITLSWNETLNATNYCLYRDQNMGGGFSNQIYSGKQMLFTDTALAENVWYYYKVQAINENGSSSKSSTISGKTQIDTMPPPVPQNLNVSDITSTSMIISWDSS
jgi:fibronectin type 3 domain-containing protein